MIFNVILNFNPLVIYGTTVLTHGIVSVFPLHKASENSILINLIYRGYSNFLLNMAFISSSEVENIYIS